MDILYDVIDLVDNNEYPISTASIALNLTLVIKGGRLAYWLI